MGNEKKTLSDVISKRNVEYEYEKVITITENREHGRLAPKLFPRICNRQTKRTRTIIRLFIRNLKTHKKYKTVKAIVEFVRL